MVVDGENGIVPSQRPPRDAQRRLPRHSLISVESKSDPAPMTLPIAIGRCQVAEGCQSVVDYHSVTWWHPRT